LIPLKEAYRRSGREESAEAEGVKGVIARTAGEKAREKEAQIKRPEATREARSRYAPRRGIKEVAPEMRERHFASSMSRLAG